METPSWSWKDFRSAKGIDGRPTVRCELNGWSALAAFLAGPERAFVVPYDPPMVRKQRDGNPSTQREPTDHETLIAREAVVEYLRVAGVPAPPEGVEWLLLLPSGIDPATFWSRLHDEMGDSTDFRPATAEAVVRAMSKALARPLVT